MEFSTQHKGIEFQTEIGPNLNKVLNGTCDVSTFTGNLELSGLEAIPRGRAKYFALASPSYIKNLVIHIILQSSHNISVLFLRSF